MNFEDKAGEYAEACIVNGKTMREAISELSEAWVEKLRQDAEFVEREAERILSYKH